MHGLWVWRLIRALLDRSALFYARVPLKEEVASLTLLYLSHFLLNFHFVEMHEITFTILSLFCGYMYIFNYLGKKKIKHCAQHFHSLIKKK